MGAARGLPTDDPCAVIDEVTLSRMDGEVSSWNTSTYTNGCSWRVTLDGLDDEVTLHYRRSVPMSGDDADFREEPGRRRLSVEIEDVKCPGVRLRVIVAGDRVGTIISTPIETGASR